MDANQMERLHQIIRYRAVEARVVRRAVMLWLLTRLAAAVMRGIAILQGVAVGSPVDVSIKTSVIVILIVVVLSNIDMRRQNVDLLLANLGTSRVATSLLALIAASCLEIVIRLLSGFDVVTGR